MKIWQFLRDALGLFFIVTLIGFALLPVLSAWYLLYLFVRHLYL